MQKFYLLDNNNDIFYAAAIFIHDLPYLCIIFQTVNMNRNENIEWNEFIILKLCYWFHSVDSKKERVRSTRCDIELLFTFMAETEIKKWNGAPKANNKRLLLDLVYCIFISCLIIIGRRIWYTFIISSAARPPNANSQRLNVTVRFCFTSWSIQSICRAANACMHRSYSCCFPRSQSSIQTKSKKCKY